MLFAIGDLHLGTGINKNMDIFGKLWENHTERLIKNWNSTVSDEDTVLIPGDISWASNLEEAAADFEIIKGLKGKKLMLMGNHDYWWQSLNKVSKAYPEISFLQNNFFIYHDELAGDFAICGTRGWLCPNENKFSDNDMKIYSREQLRLKLSLNKAVESGFKDNIICLMHFPPVNDKFEESAFTHIFEAYGVKQVIYGHLHGEECFKRVFEGNIRGVEYSLVSADYIGFKPHKISIYSHSQGE